MPSPSAGPPSDREPERPPAPRRRFSPRLSLLLTVLVLAAVAAGYTVTIVATLMR